MTGQLEPIMDDNGAERIPFMDTFYSLSSNEASERNLAAASLLEHIFSSHGKNIDDASGSVKDGCYALTRLLKGLCSGRASARQGFASCLSSFLKISFKNGPTGDKSWMELIMQNIESPGDTPINSMTPLEFIRSQLTHYTTSASESKGKKFGNKRGSEERDYLFGKLFGILAVLRSGTLVANKICSVDVLNGYLSDLLKLYHHKKWMREPATRALIELFTVTASHSLDTLDALIDGELALLFWGKDNPWTAESIALYLHLQTLYMDSKDDSREIPEILQKPLLTKDTLSDVSETSIVFVLRETSSVVHPRCHLVWDTVWLYLTQPCQKKGSRKGHPIYNHSRSLRGKGVIVRSPEEVVSVIVQNVIIKALLGGESNDETEQHNITHERRALALTLVQQLCALDLPTELLEKVVLQSTIVKKVFLHVMQKRKNGHTLQPLAIHILQQIVDSLCAIDDLWTDSCIERRLAVSRSFLIANHSFDLETSSQTVSLLLGLESTSGKVAEDSDDGQVKLWRRHLKFLEDKILEGCKKDSEGYFGSLKYIDQMFSMTKKIIRIGSIRQREAIERRTILFFMILSFFRLDKLTVKEKKTKQLTDEEQEIIEIASKIKQRSFIPYRVRSMSSSRFYSLLSDSTSILPEVPIEGSKVEARTKYTFEALTTVCTSIEALERFGAQSLTRFDTRASMSKCKEINELVNKMSHNETDGMKLKFIYGIACLATALNVQRLQPGKANDEDDDSDHDMDDEDEIDEDTCDMITDLVDFAKAVVTDIESDGVSGNDESEINPLSSVAATCVNILSCSLGGGSLSTHRVGAAKLIRDCTKTAWVGTLSLSKPPSDSLNKGCGLVFDMDVMAVLLESVCGPEVLTDSNDDDEEMEEDSDSEGRQEENDELGASIFSEVTETGMEIDGKESEESSDHTDSKESDNEEDVELDPSSLEHMLMEESDKEYDSDENVLEHHAGADSALAQLIKMKQHARKEARERRETIELSNRTRCLVLLESAFSKSNARNDILTNQVVLMSILPLLKARRALVKSTAPVESSSKKKGGSNNQKKALIDRLSSFLKNKVTKCGLDGLANVESCTTLAQQIMSELRLARDPGQKLCCSSAFVLIMKSVCADEKNVHALAQPILAEAIEEWSSKKSSRIDSSFFGDMISKSLRLSRPGLLSPLILASQKARSAFLRAEAFGLLTPLFQVQDCDTPDDKAVLDKEAKAFAASLEDAFRDEGLTKTARLRDLLKSLQKLVLFASKHGSEETKAVIGKLSSSLKVLASNSQSAGVKNSCEKLIEDIDGWEKLGLVDKSPKPKSGKKKKKKKGKKK